MSPAVRRCPRCGEALRRWTLGATQLDGCDTCGGVWFDADELRSIATSGDGLDQAEETFSPGLAGAVGDGDGKCPACRTELKKFSFPYAKAIELDGCPDCKGIWFDDGELEQLAQRVPKQHRPPQAKGGLPPAAQAALVSGLVNPRPCPACEALNPDYADRCLNCGATLFPPPPDEEVPVLDSYRVRPMLYLGKLLMVGVPLALPYVIIDELESVAWTPTGRTALWAAGGILALLAVLSFLFKAYRADVTAKGLILTSLLGQRFIPWDCLKSGAVQELGSHSPFAALRGLGRRGFGVGFGALGSFGTGIGGYGSGMMIGGSPADWVSPLELDEGGLIRLYLFTSRGVVILGPEFRGHVRLIEQVRKHM